MNFTDEKDYLRILEIRSSHLINMNYLDYRKNVIMYNNIMIIYNFEITKTLK
jgi:hypothetical protein